MGYVSNKNTREQESCKEYTGDAERLLETKQNKNGNDRFNAC